MLVDVTYVVSKKVNNRGVYGLLCAVFYAFLVKQIQYDKPQHPKTNIPIFRTHKTDRLGKWSISTVLKFPRPALGTFFSILDNLRLAALDCKSRNSNFMPAQLSQHVSTHPHASELTYIDILIPNSINRDEHTLW